MPQPNALRVVVWITLSSSLLGALFAFAENRPHGIADFVNTELHGVLAGGLNGGHPRFARDFAAARPHRDANHWPGRFSFSGLEA